MQGEVKVAFEKFLDKEGTYPTTHLVAMVGSMVNAPQKIKKLSIDRTRKAPEVKAWRRGN
jgi:hypothetical protein